MGGRGCLGRRFLCLNTRPQAMHLRRK
jgi:hypothetical protein